VAAGKKVIGPYSHELPINRWHGASYDANRTFKSLDDDFIQLQRRGAINLLYRTLVNQDMFQNQNPPIRLRMRAIYPYIADIGAEYGMATQRKGKLVPFSVRIESEGTKQRLVAEYRGGEYFQWNKMKIASLQGFTGMKREAKDSKKLISKWYTQTNNTSLMSCLRSSMLYSRKLRSNENFFNYVPLSEGQLLLLEELPILLAFYHMSSIVRYDPDTLVKLMDSKYWPMLLVLRNHGLYRFLMLFWSYMNQCSTSIIRD
jgi:hypothetical protein